MESKSQDPKHVLAVQKVSASCVSEVVLAHVALAFTEGALKYGKHNYRARHVSATTYYDAARRHMALWLEGRDYDAVGSARIHHLAKAIASLAIILDAGLGGTLRDDRPPAFHPEWMDEVNVQVKELLKVYPHPVAPFTEESVTDEIQEALVGALSEGAGTDVQDSLLVREAAAEAAENAAWAG